MWLVYGNSKKQKKTKHGDVLRLYNKLIIFIILSVSETCLFINSILAIYVNKQVSETD